MNSFNNSRRATVILALAWLVYVVSYLGRVNYNACLVEIVSETGMARSAAGMVASVFSVSYAIGHLCSGFLMRRFAPLFVLSTELFAVTLINTVFPLHTEAWYMILLWGINGIFQSTVLCGLTRLFMENLKEPYLSRGVVLLNTVGAVGGFLNYALTWLLLTYAHWKAVFWVSAALALLVGIAWVALMPRLTEAPKKECVAASGTEPLSRSLRRIFCERRNAGALLAIFICFFIGLLREGVSVWIPSFISDTFLLGTAESVITTAFVPLFQIIGAFVGGAVGRRARNLHLPAAALFSLSALCMLLLFTVGHLSLPVSTVIFVLNASCMTAALTLYLSLSPIRFFAPAEATLVVGISNFSNHLGDFAASAGIGWLSEAGGWSIVFGCLTILSALAAMLSIVGSFLFRKGEKQNVGNAV